MEDAVNPSTEAKHKKYSASHTINGHTVVFQLEYGNFRLLFAGDLNKESEKNLPEKLAANQIDLKSEVFKVPHHGSADFSADFLKAVAPVVSVISSGDESQSRRSTFIQGQILWLRWEDMVEVTSR